jgi:hypothetical protein
MQKPRQFAYASVARINATANAGNESHFADRCVPARSGFAAFQLMAFFSVIYNINIKLFLKKTCMSRAPKPTRVVDITRRLKDHRAYV